MRAVTEFQRTAVLGSAGAHIADDLADGGHGVGPHQINVATLGCRLARIVGQAAEIERRAFAGNGGDARRGDVDSVMLAVVREVVAVEQGFQDLHHFERAGVARSAC